MGAVPWACDTLAKGTKCIWPSEILRARLGGLLGSFCCCWVGGVDWMMAIDGMYCITILWMRRFWE